MIETQRRLRGHAFLPPEPQLTRIPGRYGQVDVPAWYRIAYLHYFTAGSDWWITELWQEEPGRWVAYGHARHASCADTSEWGTIDLTDLEALKVGTPIHDFAQPSHQFGYLPGLINRNLAFDPVEMWQIGRAAIALPYDIYGRTAVVAHGRRNGWSDHQIADMCYRAARDGAPPDAFARRGGEWVTAPHY